MKLFIQTEDISGSGPVHLNIFWPHYTAYSESLPTVLLTTPFRPPKSGRLRSRLQQYQDRWAHQASLCQRVRRELDTRGPNILIVWAVSNGDIRRSRLLEPVWDRLDYKVLWILDTIDPKYIKSSDLNRFDAFASICGDIGRELRTLTARPVLFMPPHTDVLRFGTAASYRPLDLVVIGRRSRTLYDPIHLHFNSPGRRTTSVDFLTRTPNFGAPVPDECRLLMGAYARAKIAICFEPSSAHPRFRGYSPMTERWPHAWASGCTVVGTKPRGFGLEAEMDWPESTIELPPRPAEAIRFLEELLEDEEGLARRRRSNVVQAALRHDSRRRLHRLLTELDVPIPEELNAGLGRLDQFATRVEAA